MVKEEDPYGGSTDENTDAEAEQDHPIPELPGMSLFALTSVSSRLFYQFLVLSQGRMPCLPPLLQTLNWTDFCLHDRHTPTSKCVLFTSVFFSALLLSPLCQKHLKLLLLKFVQPFTDLSASSHFLISCRLPERKALFPLRQIPEQREAPTAAIHRRL